MNVIDNELFKVRKGIDTDYEVLENKELFEKKKNELIGEEFLFEGNVRSNSVFNTSELIINKVIS